MHSALQIRVKHRAGNNCMFIKHPVSYKLNERTPGKRKDFQDV